LSDRIIRKYWARKKGLCQLEDISQEKITPASAGARSE